MSNSSLRGSCLCQRVQYRVKNISQKMAHCHCKDCRKFHGAAFSTFAEASLGNFEWTTGEQWLTSFVANNGSVRQFCSECGSSLTFSAKHSHDSIEFSLATLDDESAFCPEAHIFMDSKVIPIRIENYIWMLFQNWGLKSWLAAN